MGNEVVTLSLDNGKITKEKLISQINEINTVKKVTTTNEQITVFTSNGTELLPVIFQISSDLGVKIKSTLLTQPTLDDVFISYTGRELRDDSSIHNKKNEFALKRRRMNL